jgi:hypothetical protein
VLRKNKTGLAITHSEAEKSDATYVVSINLFLAEFFHQIVDLILREDQVVGEDLLVQSTRVGDDQGYVATDVSQIGQSCGHVAITDDFIVARRHGVVDAPGGEAGVGQLVPPADIDDGVRNPQLADLVIDDLFLYTATIVISSMTDERCQKFVLPRHATT